MAVRLTSFEFKHVGRPSKYPWGDWGDGSVWRTFKGTDFTCEPAMFAQSVYAYARRTGRKAHISWDDGSVTFVVVSV